MRAGFIDRDVQQRRRAAHYLAQFRVIVKVEMEMLAEAVAQRRAQQARSCGRANQRERLDRKLHRARAHPLAHHDVKLEIFHRGVQALLDGALQAMNLVDEEHVVFFEVVDDGGEIGGALDRGTGGDVEVDAELARDDVRERSLAEPGRSREQDVVEHFGASASGVDRHAENFLVAGLADEFVEFARAQREIDSAFVLMADARGDSSIGRRRRHPGIRVALTFQPAAPPTTCEL